MTPSPKSPEPSHNMTGKYAILMETSGEEFESWYYFIKIEGNEDNLKHLQDQLDQVEWYILDELSTFDLELENPVSAITAKEMTKVDLNAKSFHRKFDGKLQKINLDFKPKDGNETKICKTFDILGYGSIDEFIDDEDIDEEDLVSVSDSTDNESLSDDVSSEEDEKDDDTVSEEEKDTSNKKKFIPPSLINKDLPRFARKKQHPKK
jgi:hypothetical protein